MPDHGDTYRRELIRARYKYRGVPSRDEWELLSSLERAVAESLVEEEGDDAFTGAVEQNQLAIDAATASFLIQLDEAFPNGELTSSKIDEVETAVRESYAGLSTRAENVLIDGTSRGREAAVKGHQAGLNRMAAQVGVDVSDQAILDMMDRIRGRAQERRTVDMDTPQLMRRSAREANEATVSWIRGQVGRPGRETARTLLSELGDHPRIAEALESQGQRGENVRRAIQRAGRAAEDLQSEGKNFYTNAKRVLIHEQNQAYHEAGVLAAEESPGVKALNWQTSSRHSALQSSPDVCDVVEQIDVHGLGDGLYYPGACPSLLHPYGECQAVPVVAEPEEVGDIEYTENQVPNRKPSEIGLDEAGAIMRANLTSSSGEVTANKISRAVRVANRRIQVAYDAFVDF